MTNKAKKIDVVKILSEGGAAVKFVKGFQISKKDCYIIKAEKVNEIAGAIRDVLNRIGANEFCGVWVDSGRVYIDISERIKRDRKRGFRRNDPKNYLLCGNIKNNQNRTAAGFFPRRRK